MTPTNLEELKRAAEAATPGEWEAIDDYAIQQAGRGDLSAIAVCVPSGTRSPAEAKANAVYIIAAQPVRVLALLAENDRLRSELEAERERNEWRPIETAPKDGTVFLGIGESDEYPQPMRYERYDEESAEEIGEEGYWTYAENLIADVAGTAEPTYWRPLPEPPARAHFQSQEASDGAV